MSALEPALVLSVSGSLLTTLGGLGYIVTILRGTSRPQRVTWAIWCLSAGVITASYLSDLDAVGASWVLPFAFFLETFVITLLALRYGIGGWSRLDAACLGGALGTLVAWAVFGTPLIAVAGNVLVDVFGLVPTVRKTWGRPDHEAPLPWMLTALGGGLVVLSVQELTWMSALYPGYVAASNGLVALLSLRRRRAWEIVAEELREAA